MFPRSWLSNDGGSPCSAKWSLPCPPPSGTFMNRAVGRAFPPTETGSAFAASDVSVSTLLNGADQVANHRLDARTQRRKSGNPYHIWAPQQKGARTRSMSARFSSLPRIAWIACIAVAALREPVPAIEQTCWGCIEACYQTHECAAEAGTCTLYGCYEKSCAPFIGAPSKLDKLPWWIPIPARITFRRGLRVVPKDHGVSGRPPLVLGKGQVFVDGVEVVDSTATRTNKP